jgi:predicted nucleic acid-binding protein
MRGNGVICTQVFSNVIQTMARRLGESRQAQRRLHDECDQLAESLRSLQEQRDGAG